MRIPLLYRGEYSQWVERFINYLEKQTDGEAMINSIKNDDQPLPRVTQVSVAGTSSTEQPPLKGKSMWSDQEEKIQKIDRLARSLLIQGLPNDIYSLIDSNKTVSLIDSNKTVKDLWDALARHMLGSEYGEQDRKAAVLYEYETFKATKGELLLDTYIRYLQVINDLKKYGFLKDNYVNDAMGLKKKNVMDTSDPLALVAEKTKVNKRKEKVVVSLDSEGSGSDDFSELKKITALLEKAFNRRKFYSKPKNNNLGTSSTSESANKKQEFVKSDDKKVEKKDDVKKQDMSKEINANMVFMAQIEKVLSDSDKSSSSAEETIVEKRIEKANQQSKDFENQNKDLQVKYDVLKNLATTFEMNNKELNEQLKVLIEKNDDMLAQTKCLVIHQPPQEISIQEMEDLKQQYLDEMKRLINSEHHDEIKIDELKGNFNRMSIEINKKEKLQQLEQLANLSTYPSKRFNSFCYDDDADEDYTVVITTDFLIMNSLIMENEHLDTILETESDEFIKSSVEKPCSDPNEFNPIHNEDLDSTPKNDRFDTKSYLLESLLNLDESIPSDSEGDNLFLERLLHDDPIPLPDILDFSNVVSVFLPFFTYPVTSSILLSSGSEDTIFDPDISDYHFSSFMPVYIIRVELS
nr:hypothetical protein [Tanacetum cinerariifolium]